MIDEKRLQDAIDRSEIINVISKSILTRDSGSWDQLAECYHSEAEFTSSWWHGKAKDFVKEASKRHEEARKEGGNTKHMLANHWIQSIKGDRAQAECDVCLYNRRPVNGVELDFATWSRRVYLLQKEGGEWKIWRRFSIYDKARMDPVDLTVDPKSYFDAKAMEKYPKAMRIHMWRLEVKWSGASEKIGIKGTDEETRIRENAQKWIDAA